jgi:Sigma-70 region 2
MAAIYLGRNLRQFFTGNFLARFVGLSALTPQAGSATPIESSVPFVENSRASAGFRRLYWIEHQSPLHPEGRLIIAHHHGLIHHLHRLLPAVSEDSDVELLELYVRLRDERAFATLVHRHGAMVLGVCNRIVGNLQTAEDAYQATFLALARHAGSIRRPAALAAWLYGTAQRIAWKACAAAARRTRLPIPGPTR